MYSLVAMLNCVTALPLDRLRISGSRVRRPVNRTLFTVRVLLLDRPTGNRADPAWSGGIDTAGRGGRWRRPLGLAVGSRRIVAGPGGWSPAGAPFSGGWRARRWGLRGAGPRPGGPAESCTGALVPGHPPPPLRICPRPGGAKTGGGQA